VSVTLATNILNDILRTAVNGWYSNFRIRWCAKPQTLKALACCEMSYSALDLEVLVNTIRKLRVSYRVFLGRVSCY
jgi:hypothetical protein